MLLLFTGPVSHPRPPFTIWHRDSLIRLSTRSGPNDQANFEALYAVGGILLKLKPRIATLEQTFGLLSYEEHRQAFKLFLNQVINAGYDIRYKIENLLMHGLPQARKRLLMIAAK